MNAFANLKTDSLQEAEDRVGGFAVFPTNYYDATVKAAYAGAAASGAMNVTVILDIDGKELRDTIYVTNKQGQNFFVDKQDPSKKVALPGFRVVDDLCLLTTGMSLSEQEVEEKVVNVYDPDAKREVPKGVQMFTALIGKPVGLAIVQILENKTKKVGTEYVPTDETREVNNIEKVFHSASGLTAVEVRNNATNAAFKEAWVARHAGKARDKRAKGAGGGARAGAPQPGQKPKNNLFANI